MRNIVEIRVTEDATIQLVETVPALDGDSGEDEVLVLLQNGKYGLALTNNRWTVVEILKLVLLPMGWRQVDFDNETTSFSRS